MFLLMTKDKLNIYNQYKNGNKIRLHVTKYCKKKTIIAIGTVGTKKFFRVVWLYNIRINFSVEGQKCYMSVLPRCYKKNLKKCYEKVRPVSGFRHVHRPYYNATTLPHPLTCTLNPNFSFFQTLKSSLLVVATSLDKPLAHYFTRGLF